MKKVTKSCLACLVMLSIVIGSLLVGKENAKAADGYFSNGTEYICIAEGETITLDVPKGVGILRVYDHVNGISWQFNSDKTKVTITGEKASRYNASQVQFCEGDGWTPKRFIMIYVVNTFNIELAPNETRTIAFNQDPEYSSLEFYVNSLEKSGNAVQSVTVAGDEKKAITVTAAGADHAGETSLVKIINDRVVAYFYFTVNGSDPCASGHTSVTDAAVAPTCTETGLTEGSHCSVCNTVLTAQTTIAANGHTPVTDAAVVPTCTATGLTEGSHCSVCNTVLTAQTTIAAKGHTSVTDAAVAPTCTATGLTEGSHCSVCNAVLVAQTTVAANGHTPATDEAEDATCTETGLTEGSHCSVCDAVIVAQEVVPALGHTEVIDVAVAATCTGTGLTEGSHCSVCKAILEAQEVTEANGHTVVIDEAVEATCTGTGLTEGSHCSVCNEVLEEQEEVPALGHDWDNGVVTTAPTLETPGVRTFTCQNDNSHLRTEEIPVLTPAPEEDPEDDDSSTTENNNSSTPEDNNSSTPEDNNSSTPEDNNSSAPVDNNSSTPAEESSDAPQVTPPVQPQQPEQEVQGAVVDKPENSAVAPETSTPVVAPVENTTTTSKPDTGDHSQPVLYIMLMMIAAVGMIVVKKATKKKSYR